jgi:hypothetical protein
MMYGYNGDEEIENKFKTFGKSGHLGGLGFTATSVIYKTQHGSQGVPTPPRQVPKGVS